MRISKSLPEHRHLQMLPVVLVDSSVGRQRSRGQGLSWYRFDWNCRLLLNLIEIVYIVHHILWLAALVLRTPVTWRRFHWGYAELVVVFCVAAVVVIVVLVSGHITLTLLQYHIVQMACLLHRFDIKDPLARLAALGRYVGYGQQKIGNVLVQRESRAR